MWLKSRQQEVALKGELLFWRDTTFLDFTLFFCLCWQRAPSFTINTEECQKVVPIWHELGNLIENIISFNSTVQNHES